ncbi:2-polyprenyl-6-methoxyphenol hydroxylase-like FAD-dependent oxidoreductase [Pararhizobium capsulatum DSM 1112]|uniref:2-polyprenyl-6-methoxyphenol hydroxylase-like FAD-dependent oxidoreductase n=1 Tax=Pararhizobium capsulatum DSM 1112 TaxID=1121113 RepID=A0ABU0BTC3_9HYPH|nr:NAD(P)/FAD-dependent oxidoreductase [Pararhizobium capsulatum]MDQ0320916.1 2-polyprenyl-6-methoxyphenol hydroxylase-like FAD-dependent oxidoreductase [Pararhizobium capsulatum DSM 1112]
MEARPETSILIAGAGPVGLALALELVRRGMRPRLVAKAAGPTPANESRALGVNARTLTLLEECGATALILHKARRINRFRVASRGKTLLTVDTARLRGRYSPLYALPQGETENILINLLAQHHITPEWQTAVAHVEGGIDKPQVLLRHADGTSETVSPNILVGADGAHSVVRENCGFTFPGSSIDMPFHLADYRYTRPIETNYAEGNFLNPGVLARIPVREDTIRYISTREDFETIIEHPAEVRDKPWVSSFRISFRHVESMRRGRVFLAGDAAHVHSPIGARGMNLGIEDACWLAWLISERREEEYSELRMPAIETVIKATRRNTAFVTLSNPVLTGLRRLLLPWLSLFPASTRAVLRTISGRDTPAPPWIPGAK